MVGSALLRYFKKNGYTNLHATYHTRSPSKQDPELFISAGFEPTMLPETTWHQCDHIDQLQTDRLIQKLKPNGLLIAAAKVGGILANNSYRADFIYSNTAIEANLIHSAYTHGVKKLIFLGSACIYPKAARQPIKEEELLTGPLESTNEPYAIAKIAGLKMCESYHRQYGSNFFSLMPSNLYGPGDNFDLQESHVLPALIRKFYEAKINREKSVTIWGTGKPYREFLHVDDLAQATMFCYEHLNAEDLHAEGISHINIGTGVEISILELAELIRKTVSFNGIIEHDLDKPDGMQKKLLDSDRIKSFGWSPSISLTDGIKSLVKEIVESPSWGLNQ